MKRRALLLCITTALGVWPQQLSAAVDPSALGSVVVMDDGRKKPLDTYARSALMGLSGRDHVGRTAARAWLAGVLFDPMSVARDKVLLINDPGVVDAMGVERQKRRYSFLDIHRGLGMLDKAIGRAERTDASARSAFDNEVLRLSAGIRNLGDMMSVFSFADPFVSIDDSSFAGVIGVPAGSKLSYWELLAVQPRLHAAMMEFMSGPASRPWSRSDSALVGLLQHMRQRSSSVGNPPPHIIPATTDSGEQWFSPWGYVAQFGTSARESPALVALLEVRQAYVAGDQQQFDRSVASFRKAVEASAAVPPVAVELAANRLNAFSHARVLYAIALLCALGVLFGFRPRLSVAMALAATAGALLLHTTGIVLRVVVMHRPPVTNLYETFVFVAWACAVLGLVAEAAQRRGIGLLVAGAGGFAFLHLAGRYGADGDTMGMLAAVLNNNFWLTTHIMTITLGYAGCCAAGVAGHVYLVKHVLRRDTQSLDGIDRAAYGLLLFGLAFTVVGTVLGGMWADQSWGRFWGWDPKENGALLIILWAAAVVHARRGGMIAGAGTAVGSVIALALVMLAWVGVNLLGIGMHAYGFTSSGARALAALLSVEAAFLVAVAIATWRSGRVHRPG